ncbi:hypothetical protein B0J18DRAFT_302592 [Chaetomium sp. MPI-SDFR-AT-0129]|nr:hypothetical protein B0J18DRAFT_302592 [Chaetomium sp. MPI-SDFR-AT-0129]
MFWRPPREGENTASRSLLFRAVQSLYLRGVVGSEGPTPGVNSTHPLRRGLQRRCLATLMSFSLVFWHRLAFLLRYLSPRILPSERIRVISPLRLLPNVTPANKVPNEGIGVVSLHGVGRRHGHHFLLVVPMAAGCYLRRFPLPVHTHLDRTQSSQTPPRRMRGIRTSPDGRSSSGRCRGPQGGEPAARFGPPHPRVPDDSEVSDSCWKQKM